MSGIKEDPGKLSALRSLPLHSERLVRFKIPHSHQFPTFCCRFYWWSFRDVVELGHLTAAF